MVKKMRFFHSMRQQLVNEIMFVRNVSRPYRDIPANLHIVDFDYKGMPCKLILDEELNLKTERGTTQIASYNDLIKGLIQSNYPNTRAA